MTYNLNKTYGNEIPPEFQFLQGGTFINLLPKTLEENLVEYYQYFTTETNQEILTKKANQMLIQLHTNYLNETGWIWQKYQRNVVVLKDMTEEEFVTKYQEIIDSQEFARSEIGRLEQLVINVKGKI